MNKPPFQFLLLASMIGSFFVSCDTNVADSSNNARLTTPSPVFSRSAGLFSDPFDLIISATSPNDVIRYTLDGQDPTLTVGTVYTNKVPITLTTTVKARAWNSSGVASDMTEAIYTFDWASYFDLYDGAAWVDPTTLNRTYATTDDLNIMKLNYTQANAGSVRLYCKKAITLKYSFLFSNIISNYCEAHLRTKTAIRDTTTGSYVDAVTKASDRTMAVSGNASFVPGNTYFFSVDTYTGSYTFVGSISH